MKYLLFAIINTVYGVLLFLTLSSDTPGFFIVFTIATVLTLLGLSGFVLWLRLLLSSEETKMAKKETVNAWWQLVKSFDIVLVIGLLFRAVIIQPFIVDGSSMDPNFHNNEAILVDKISFRFRQPQRGEVIVFRAPENPQDDYIKRIIAFPGETVRIENSKVFINGKELEEIYLSPDVKTVLNENTSVIFQQTLKDGEYFVMGDNRQHSSDSREWGPLPEINIIGRAAFTVYPLQDAGLIRTPKLTL